MPPRGPVQVRQHQCCGPLCRTTAGQACSQAVVVVDDDVEVVDVVVEVVDVEVVVVDDVEVVVVIIDSLICDFSLGSRSSTHPLSIRDK